MTMEKVPAAVAGAFVFLAQPRAGNLAKLLKLHDELWSARRVSWTEIAAIAVGYWLTLGANAAEIG